jgi:hypothetical protein
MLTGNYDAAALHYAFSKDLVDQHGFLWRNWRSALFGAPLGTRFFIRDLLHVN